MNLKQEHLIYALGVAAVIIVVLLGTVLYYLTKPGTSQTQQPGAAAPAGEAQQLPPGHPPVDPSAGKEAPPLTQDMVDKLGGTGAANSTPSNSAGK